MKRTVTLVLAVLMLLSSLSWLTGCKKKGKDEYEDGKLVLNLRNLYFNDWGGDDDYTRYINEKFGVVIKPASYSWADWDSQVYNSANADNLPDVFHFSLDSYNFSKSYDFWREGGSIRALPSDLSRWPHLRKMLSGISNLDELRADDGQLYCLPIAKNPDATAADAAFSPFTYVYRRDWAKELGVYQENDVYTWDQFVALIDAFYRNKCQSGDIVAIADVEWGFPSVINFFKTAPHCYAVENGRVVSNYTTSSYLQGLEVARRWASDPSGKYYGFDQYAANDGDVAKQYYGGRVGVFYENLSLSNYTTLRNKMAQRSEIDTKEKLDDVTAIMKVMGPDGKYVLEGGENWFSATFFNADMSDEKMEKVLDILDWLLSEEGTRMATYGIEGYDYEIDASGNITLLETGWEKDMDGRYVDKYNGAKYLRYMATLGYDMDDDDPLVDKTALAVLDDWNAFMNEQYKNGKLRILSEDPRVKWLATDKKSTYSDGMLDDGITSVVQYVYGKIDMNTFRSQFSSRTWNEVLAEINDHIGR